MAPITTLYAALLALLFIVLAGVVVRGRLRHKIDLGAGARGELEQQIRAHANLAEYAPVFLILLLLAELGGAAAGLLHAMGATFVIARVMHAAGLNRARGESFGRYWGTVLTWLLIVALAVYLLVRTIAAT
jgi:hypothetical protein